MIVSNNSEINMISKNMEREFKKRVKKTNFNGRPYFNGKITRTYLKYLKNNPFAPVPKGKIFYKNKVINRSKLEDKRYKKKGIFKPSVLKELTSLYSEILLPLRSKLNKKIITIDNPNFKSSKYIIKDLDIGFLTENGRNIVSIELSKLRRKASINYNPNSSSYILTFYGIKITEQLDIDGNKKIITSDFRLNISDKKLKAVNKDFEEYWEDWVQNNTVAGSLTDVIINRIELRIIGTNQNVGSTGGHYKSITIDGLRIKDFESKGINNCFFWVIEDWVKQKYNRKSLTTKLCNNIREEFNLEKDSKISGDNCIKICKVLFNKNIYIINRYDRDITESINSEDYDRTLFIMNNHIYLYEGEYKSNYCELCKTTYIHKHNKKSCERRVCFLNKKRLVLANKRLVSKDNKEKLVLHYDIETHTDNERHEHVPYIVGFTHYDFIKKKWIYGTFEGNDCMEVFYNYIRNCPKIIYLNAYNGNRFDAFYLAKLSLNDDDNNKSEICINAGSILKLTIPKLIEAKKVTKKIKCKPYILLDEWVSPEEFHDRKKQAEYIKTEEYITYPNLTTFDLCRHLDGSLKDNLEGNNCKVSKGDIDHNISTYWENTEPERREEVKQYLECDVLGLRELYEKFNNNSFKDYGVNLCDYLTGSQLCYDLWRTLFLDDEIVELPNSEMDTYFRKSIYGGRCYPNKKSFISKSYKDIIDGKIPFEDVKDYLIDGDIVSLYPYVMTFEYPVGHHIKTKSYQKNKMGIYRCEFITNKKLLIPPIPRRDKKGLIWDLEDGEGHYTSIDIERSESVGYKFKIIDGVYWEKKAPIYKKYMETFYEKKKQAKKGTPAYSTAKRNLNALYGKQIQRPIYTNQKTVRTRKELLNIMIKNRITDVLEITSKNWLISFEPIIIEDSDKKVNKPTHQGSFILAYSRNVMWNQFVASEGLYDMKNLFFYTDTDSIQLHVDACEKLKFGENMGDISNDLGDDCKIIKGIWVQPKLYMLEYITKDMKVHRHYRGAGVPMEQLEEGVYNDLLAGKKRRFSPDFQIKKNLLNHKNRRYNNGIIENTNVDLFSLYHYKNSDIDCDGKLVLEKILGTEAWSGRNFHSNNISYPKGFEF